MAARPVACVARQSPVNQRRNQSGALDERANAPTPKYTMAAPRSDQGLIAHSSKATAPTIASVNTICPIRTSCPIRIPPVKDVLKCLYININHHVNLS